MEAGGCARHLPHPKHKRPQACCFAAFSPLTVRCGFRAGQVTHPAGNSVRLCIPPPPPNYQPPGPAGAHRRCAVLAGAPRRRFPRSPGGLGRAVFRGHGAPHHRAQRARHRPPAQLLPGGQGAQLRYGQPRGGLPRRALLLFAAPLALPWPPAACCSAGEGEPVGGRGGQQRCRSRMSCWLPF